MSIMKQSNTNLQHNKQIQQQQQQQQNQQQNDDTSDSSNKKHDKKKQKSFYELYYNDQSIVYTNLREIRHNQYYMIPICIVLCILFVVYGILNFAIQLVSTIVVTILVRSILFKYTYYIIEFIYPTTILKYGHLFLINLIQKSRNNISSTTTTSSTNTTTTTNNSTNNNEYHSRCIETRIEVITNSIYIHPLPQFLDNIGYVIICIPPQIQQIQQPQVQLVQQPEAVFVSQTTTTNTPKKVHQQQNDCQLTSTSLIAIVIDCGDADTILKQLSLISTIHYNKRTIIVHSILSTHKHHDHTAGNLAMLQLQKQQQEQQQQQQQLQNDLVDSSNKSSSVASASAAINSSSLVLLNIQYIFGGAVEAVPGCNYPLCNGDTIPLPYPMNTFIEIDSICTPGHTRGSLTYILRPLEHILVLLNQQQSCNQNQMQAVSFLFTGDTLFSGGSGVPFEADVPGTNIDTSNNTCYPNTITSNSFLLASTGTNAIERSFAEMLYRSVATTSSQDNDNNYCHYSNNEDDDSTTNNTISRYRTVSNNQIVVCPGHEYTTELLSRQLTNKESLINNWKSIVPIYYFTTISHYYTVLQRRYNLPTNTGKLLCAISTIENELYINPHFRIMIQRGEILLNSIQQWNRNWSCNPINIDNSNVQGSYGINELKRKRKLQRNNNNNNTTITTNSNIGTTTSTATSTKSQWNITSTIINQPVFTTVYTNDIDSIINDLYNNTISTIDAAKMLEDLCTNSLHVPIVTRRSIPTTLPSNKVIYKGLLSLALLGSSPCGLTKQDAITMKLNTPINYNSDCIRISKQRLIIVLYHLGLLDCSHNGKLIVAIIHNLWIEAKEYMYKSKSSTTFLQASSEKNDDDDLEIQHNDRDRTEFPTESSEMKYNTKATYDTANTTAAATTTTSSTTVLNDTIDSTPVLCNNLNNNINYSRVSSTTTLDDEVGTDSTLLHHIPKNSRTNDNTSSDNNNNNDNDDDDDTNCDDIVPLGALKWIIYGIPEQQKSHTYFKRIRSFFCQSCHDNNTDNINNTIDDNNDNTRTSSDMPSKHHPAGKSNWSVHAGELVRHDLLSCHISQSATGYDTTAAATTTFHVQQHEIQTAFSYNPQRLPPQHDTINTTLATTAAVTETTNNTTANTTTTTAITATTTDLSTPFDFSRIHESAAIITQIEKHPIDDNIEFEILDQEEDTIYFEGVNTIQ